MSTLYRARVVRKDTEGVFVEIPELGEGNEWGPLEMADRVPLALEDSVIVGSINEILEDLALVAKLVTEAYEEPAPYAPPSNAKFVLYYENAAARNAAVTSPTSGVATWLDDEQRLEIYTDEGTPGWVAYYGIKSSLLLLPTGTKIGLGVTAPTAALEIASAASTDEVITTKATADTQKRLTVAADGTFRWSTGAAVSDTFLSRSGAGQLYLDNRLTVGTSNTAASASYTARQSTNRTGYFSNNNEVSVTHSLAHFYASEAGNDASRLLDSYKQGETQSRFLIEVAGKMYWGVGGSTPHDTNMYRNGVGILRTDGAFQAGGSVSSGGTVSATTALSTSGDATADNVIATNSVFAGPNVADLGWGLIAYAQATTDSSGATSASQIVFLTSNSATFRAGRAYRIVHEARYKNSAAVANNSVIMFRKTNTAGQQLSDLGRLQMPAQTVDIGVSVTTTFICGASNVTTTIALCGQSNNAGTNLIQAGNTGFPRSFWIYDIGPASPAYSSCTALV